MSTQPIDMQHPWPGLDSYGEEAWAFFHGRTREADELLALIKRETLAVLYGRSGLGKTSLVQAGLFPRLRQEDFLPVRVHLLLDDTAPELPVQIADALVQASQTHGIEAPPLPADLTLWEYFHHRDTDFWSADDRLVTPVLVLDQFEEIFTLGRENPVRRARCDALLVQIGDLVENRQPKAVRQRLEANPELAQHYDPHRSPPKILLSFREDYLADFDIIYSHLRARLGNRMRLLPMVGDIACQAIVAAGRHASGPALASLAVAEQIVRFIDRRDQPLDSLHIEPALLSLVCRELNDKRLAQHRHEIVAELMHDDSAPEIIANFYQKGFAGLDPQVQHFVEDHLLTKDGHRDSCALDNALAEPGVSEHALQSLVDRRILRREARGGRVRLELIHDALTPAAKASRDARRQAQALAEARRQMATQRRRQRLFAAAMVVLLVVLSGISWLGWEAVQARDAAVDARLESDHNLSLALAEKADRAFAENRTDLGLTYAAHALARMLPSRVEPALSQQERDYLQTLSHWRREYFQRLVSSRVEPAYLQALGIRYQVSGFADATLRVRGSGPIRAAAFSPDGKALASTGWNGIVWLQDLASQKPLGQPLRTHAGMVWSVAFSPDGKTWASAGSDKTVRLWDVASQKPLGQPLRGHDDEVLSVAFSPDGKTLASAGWDGNVRLWDLASQKPLGQPLRGHEKSVSFVAFSPDGKTLASASSDKTVRLWELASQRPLGQPLRGHDDEVLSVAFSPDGKTLASGDVLTVRLWDLASQKPLGEPHGTPGSYLAFSPEGKALATDGANGVRLWDVASHEPLPPLLRGHPDSFLSVAFSRKGSTLAGAGSDGTVWLWDAASGHSLGQPLRGHEKTVTAVAFSPDGRTVASASEDGTVRLWPLFPEQRGIRDWWAEAARDEARFGLRLEGVTLVPTEPSVDMQVRLPD